MKKFIVLAMSAILAVNLSAQEVKAEKAACKKEKKECKLSKEERINLDIKILSDELYLSEEQSAQFAEVYREFKAEQAALEKKFKAKFGQSLNERQVERVLHYRGPHGPHPDFQKGEHPKCEKGAGAEGKKAPHPKN